MNIASRVGSVLAGGVLAALVSLPLTGCDSSSGDNFKAASNQQSPMMADAAIPVRFVRSDVVDFSDPNVDVTEGTVTLAGNIRVHPGKDNPQATLQITVMKRNGAVDHEMTAKLNETDQPEVLQYKIAFGPVPDKGQWLTITYNDWHPEKEFTGADIGQGASDVGGAGRSGRNSGSSNFNPKGPTGPVNHHSSGSSGKGSPHYGGSTPLGGSFGNMHFGH